MLLSFAVYTGLALILSFLGWHISQRENRLIINGGKELPFYSWEIVVSILLFAIVAGARYKTGYDYIAYYNQYNWLCEYNCFRRKDYEIGFEIISKVFAFFKAHVFFYFTFWGGLQISLFYFAFRKNKNLLPWLALIIMLGGYFVGWMNSIRQVVVECAFIALIPFCTNRNKLAIACLISIGFMTIHKSAFLVAIFLCIMWLMRNVALSRKTTISIFMLCVLFGVYPIWISFFDSCAFVLEGTDYEKYIPLLDEVTSGGNRLTKWGPNHIMVIVSQLLVLWYYPFVKSRNSNDINLNRFFILSFWGMCLGNLLINTSHFVLRPIEYLILCSVVVYAYTMRTLFKEKCYFPLVLLSLSTLTITYIAVVKAVYVPTEINTPFLYNVIFLK